MRGPSTSRVLRLPVVNDRPIEQGKEGAIVLHQRIMLEQSGDRRLVKEMGRGYHSTNLLLLGGMDFVLLCKRSSSAVKGNRTFVLESHTCSSNELLATG